MMVTKGIRFINCDIGTCANGVCTGGAIFRVDQPYTGSSWLFNWCELTTHLPQLPVLYAEKQLCTMPAHAQAAVASCCCFCHGVSQCGVYGFRFRPSTLPVWWLCDMRCWLHAGWTRMAAWCARLPPASRRGPTLSPRTLTGEG